MWINKKKYNELVAQKDDFERIATDAVAQNDRLLDKLHEVLEETKSIQALNHRLIEHNDELLTSCEGLKAKLDFAIKQRDYYYDLLENTSEVEERNE